MTEKKPTENKRRVKRAYTTEFTFEEEVPLVLAGKGSAWHIVTNNPTDGDWDRLRERQRLYQEDGVWNSLDIVYEMWALENARDRTFMEKRLGIKLTPHFQTAIVFRKPKTFEFVRSLFPRSHVEPVKRCFVSNYLYISKSAPLQSYGNIREGMLSWPVAKET